MFRNKLKSKIHNFQQDNYDSSICIIKNLLGTLSTRIDKIAFLDYMINAIGIDIQGDALTRKFCFSNCQYLNDNQIYSKCLPIFPCRKEVLVDFSNKTVVCSPYNINKLTSAITDIHKEGFKFEKNYFSGLYYPDINLLIITNGVHHISATNFLKLDGTCMADVYDMKNCFDLYTIKNNYWYRDSEQLFPMYDYRFGILYYLAKIKNELNQNS